MAVPSPSVKPLQEPGGTHTFVFNGEIGQSGSAQDLNIDLTEIPLYIRKDPRFQNQLYVILKSLDSNVTFAGPAVLGADEFHDDGAETNAYVTIQVTSDAVDREIMLLVEPRHSIGR